MYIRIIKTTKLKILSKTKSFAPTLEIYKHALAFYLEAIPKELGNIEIFNNNKKLLVLENLTHKTKQHPTAKYIFDDSRELVQNAKKDLATFKTGKIYSSALSSNYDVGTRYLIKELQKTTMEAVWLQVQAKPTSVARIQTKKV